jgi:sporulation protein YlmC with PRC-barrel domain
MVRPPRTNSAVRPKPRKAPGTLLSELRKSTRGNEPMRKLLQMTVLSAALVASALVLAQTAPPQPGAQPQWVSPVGLADGLFASKLIGTSVKNTAGETIGDINEVVLGKDGKVAAVVIGVGGFLGLGEREVAVSFESLQLGRGEDQRTTAMLNTNKEALKAAPEWKRSGAERRN